MKLICSRDNLLEAINAAQRAVSTKATSTISEGILIETLAHLTLSANNNEIGIESYVSADVSEKGSVVINSKMFGDIIRKMPNAEILIDVSDDYTIKLECENSHFKLKGISSEGFPKLQEVKKDNFITVKESLLKDILKQTSFAISEDPKRNVLTGLLIECKNREFNAVAIDGFRLAMRKSIISSENIDFSVIIPGNVINEVYKILRSQDEEVYIYSADNQILFESPHSKIVSRLIEGNYLNYKTVIPNEFEIKFIVDTKLLLSSIERVSLLISDENKYPLKININEDVLMMYCNTTVGEVKEEIIIDGAFNNFEIGFNPRYFTDALRVIEDEKIELCFTSNVGPCVIRPIEDNNYTYMILPVRTSE